MKKLLLAIMFIAISVSSYSQLSFTDAKNYITNHGYVIANENANTASEGEYIYNYRMFYAGVNYALYASSTDVDVTDVDMYIVNPDETIFTKDNDNSKVAVVNFTLLYDAYLKVVVYNHVSKTPSYKSLIQYFVAYK